MNFALIANGKDSLVNYYNQILEIAIQCPYVGGPAVFRARSLVGLFNDSISYEEDCSGNSLARGQNPELKSGLNSNVTIRPNPANDKLVVTLNQKYSGICKIEIINSLGSIALSEQHTCKEKNIDLNIINLKQGVYSVKILLGENIIHVAKLVISR